MYSYHRGFSEYRPEFLRRRLGKNGVVLWNYANGNDLSLVAKKDFVSPIKSVGHGITTVADLEKPEQVWPVFLELTQDIGHKLRVHGLSAEGVAIHIRDNTLNTRQWQTKIALPTQSPMIIASVKARSNGEKCPICSGARVIAGINDLATLEPLLVKQWSKKNKIKPTEVSIGSHKKVIWRCEKGHEWEAAVKSRTINKTGCPYCSHNKVLAGFNDLIGTIEIPKGE